MQAHEHFEELCALAAIGQLSPEEHQELLTHLRVCDLCKRAGDDFALILGQLPLVEPPDVSGDTEALLSESYRQRFLHRASAEGISLTDEAKGIPKRRKSHRSLIPSEWYGLGLATTAVVILVIGALTGKLTVLGSGNQPTQASSALVHDEDAKATKPGSDPPGKSASVANHGDSHPELERQLAVLKLQLAQAVQDKEGLRAASERLEQQMELQRAQSEKSGEALSAASAELEKLRNEHAQIVATLVEREVRIQELAHEVNIQAAAVEGERQLGSVAKDVREFMAARNLHMIDVYDFDARGKPNKSFGRVFYIERKALIFYAFDLDRKGSASKVAFQAWGQRESGYSAARNLGVFHIDDHVQRRWVLRVDDPQLLSSIDSVFVTVEPSPGRDKPSGKKLLYAYLGAPANHP